MGKNVKWLIIAVVCTTLGYAGWRMLAGSGAIDDSVPTTAVKRGPLQISVLQGGEIRALENLEIKSEIEIPTKILSLIPEGYLISEEDVKNGKVLIELDDTEVKTKIQNHEIDFQTTVSAYIDADENREIQKSENQSFVRAIKEVGIFALMDFEKYLGREVTSAILVKAGLPKEVQAFEQHAAVLESQANTPVDAKLATEKATTQPGKKSVAKPTTELVDFTQFLETKSGSTDGEAQQKLRQLEDELLLRRAELAVAKQKVEASTRLSERNYISKAQLENDQVTHEKVVLAVKTAETELHLFKKYAFSKMCSTLLSAYREAINKLQRTIRENRARMAQAETRFNTAKRRHEMELTQRDNLDRQLKACIIKATQPGLVAYGDLNAGSSYNSNYPIEEGATVRLRQTMLTIPNMSQMGVRVNIHESQVKKIKLGQPVLIRVDAEANEQLHGKVAELAILPDSSSSRYTPNLKVYPCTIHIDGYQPWMKPGMNAKVEVIVNQLADVMYVPVQSIEVDDDHHYCYVQDGSSLQRREISTGLFNDDYIEVVKGLQLGEAIALTLPKKVLLEEGVPVVPAAPETKPKSAKPKEKSIAAAKS